MLPKIIYDFDLNKPLEVQVLFVPCIAWILLMKNSKRKSMNRLYARDSKERTGPKSVFTLLTVQCSSLPGLRIGEDGLWSRGGATVVSVGPEAKTHGTLASGMGGGMRGLKGRNLLL